MRIQRRKPNFSKSSDLPADYLKMVAEVFDRNFEAGVKTLQAIQSAAEPGKFTADGAVFSDEVLLAVSFAFTGQLSANTAYASVDFDPTASSPNVQDLLSACVDALGGVFSELLDPKKPAVLEALAAESLAHLEAAPFEWTEIESGRFRVFVRIDKGNLGLERLADDWLAKNDPDFLENLEREEKETESLFVTGAPDAKRKGKGGGPESLH